MYHSYCKFTKSIEKYTVHADYRTQSGVSECVGFNVPLDT